ncbi:hypothetical protein [Arthrospiribacter ruber]|uniref:Uncharacterized protein n=1 Tax=Arthrospiribacter ruber TaxID=2487934 RepID=A0A951IW23_9BACT|nr:hypothetical protein [Arthrospiribacter ruber]MBW3466939.1 hypothetical protein [Arthrospiribacter ruber]
MDLDQLKDVWKKAELQAATDSEEELRLKLQKVTSTESKLRKYFRFEITIALCAIVLILAIIYFSDDLEPFIYKLFSIVFLGSIPVTIRLYLSMKRIIGIKYTAQLKESITAARDHLKTTITLYYASIMVTVTALVIMSWFDNFFLQLPLAWKVGVMGYLFIFLIGSIRLVNKYYGSRLKELQALLRDM